MAVMIWDTEEQAFRDADTPMRYDAAAGAWGETTGMKWNDQVQAWEEVWSPLAADYTVYDLSGGIDNTGGYNTVAEIAQNVGSARMDASGIYVKGASVSGSGTYGLIFRNRFPLSKYKYLYFNIKSGALSGNVGGYYIMGYYILAKNPASSIDAIENAYATAPAVTPEDWNTAPRFGVVKVDMGSSGVVDGYIGFRGYCNNGYMLIDKVWLSNF